MLWIAISFLFFLVSPAASTLDGSVNDSTKQRREQIVARHGAVAADDGRCSMIGTNVLRIGGHAVDAAVAASLCLGVVSPGSSGIGGGSFMLLREANGKAQVFDMRETAPMKASENMFVGNATLKASGGLSIAVPGQLAGLHKAWEQHGKLPWKRLVKPAETLAQKGFKISPYLRMQMESSKSSILADKGLLHVFAPNGELLKVGDICYNKKLAETLHYISVYGVAAFYNGSIGANLVKDIENAGGILTLTDLKKYEVKMREPVSANVLGLEILSMPPPSSGGASMALINDHGTSHVSIVDANGNAVSITNTVNAFFGSKILSPSTGIVLNNEMDDFSMPSNNTSGNTPPVAPSNFVRPGKRPLSSMTPTIVLKDGKLKALVGASGGANIIAGTTQVFLNHFALGMDPLSSVMAPRVYHQLIPNVVMYENWTTVIGDHFEVPATIRSDLQKKGHVLQVSAVSTVSQFIVHNLDGLKGNGELVAVSDPRKGRFPAGF
ncbi:Gamma-glutamyltranspeptidase 1 [Hibiscus syriacus]|uniref:Gamma-glutamyltranspeptidase 1 n=1 Tax=Hibiscus syriacus TaxID=106335 RepID=A0A6A2XNT1_HIBSY|nr:Gamma-glutamyltranspeptidase 1 [Hibiscus syriacus]